MPTKIDELTTVVSVKSQAFTTQNPKLANIQLVFIQEGYGEDGIFYPAQSITIFGKAINKLREVLSVLPPE